MIDPQTVQDESRMRHLEIKLGDSSAQVFFRDWFRLQVETLRVLCITKEQIPIKDRICGPSEKSSMTFHEAEASDFSDAEYRRIFSNFTPTADCGTARHQCRPANPGVVFDPCIVDHFSPAADQRIPFNSGSPPDLGEVYYSGLT
ncbi:MAG: hypothetical protein AAF627_22210 [Myxococcota bacterium]